MLNKAFFDHVRKACFDGRLSKSAVKNMQVIYEAWLEHPHGPNPRAELAYIFATARGEVGPKMEPVRETFAKTDSEAIATLEHAWKTGRLPQVKTPYWRDGFFGRGYPQLTHRSNYQKQAAKHGLDLVRHPEMMLTPAIAARVMISGMYDGDFTGRSLSDFIRERAVDFHAARTIVNGLDRADKFADYAVAFHTALETVSLEKKEEKKMNTGVLSGVIRHALTFVGGIVGSDGVLSGDEMNMAAGAIATLVGLAWSVVSKR